MIDDKYGNLRPCSPEYRHNHPEVWVHKPLEQRLDDTLFSILQHASCMPHGSERSCSHVPSYHRAVAAEPPYEIVCEFYTRNPGIASCCRKRSSWKAIKPQAPPESKFFDSDTMSVFCAIFYHISTPLIIQLAPTFYGLPVIEQTVQVGLIAAIFALILSLSVTPCINQVGQGIGPYLTNMSL